MLCCDDMVPGEPTKFEDGPAETLWERMLWRMFDGDMGRIAQIRAPLLGQINYRRRFDQRSGDLSSSLSTKSSTTCVSCRGVILKSCAPRTWDS